MSSLIAINEMTHASEGLQDQALGNQSVRVPCILSCLLEGRRKPSAEVTVEH